MLIHINPLYNLNNQGGPFFIANHVHVHCPIHPKMLLIGRWLRSFGSFAFTLTWTEAAGVPLLLLRRTGNYQPNWCFGFERIEFNRCKADVAMVCAVCGMKTVEHFIYICSFFMTFQNIVSELLLNTFASHLDSTGPFWNWPRCAFALPFLATSNHDLYQATIFLAAKWTVWGRGWLICQSCNNDFFSHNLNIFLLNLINHLAIWSFT